MSQQVEIEFKNMLTKEEFTLIKSHFQIDDSLFLKQVNHYFDTPNFSLKEIGCALRIRQKKNQYEMTLKQPLQEGLLETNQPLSQTEAAKIIQSGKITEGPVKNELNKLPLALEKLEYFGSLTTLRAEKEYKNGILVLDNSSYLKKHDFEIEYEVSDYKAGKEVFEELLQFLHIPLRKTANKVRRFYEEKYKQS